METQKQTALVQALSLAYKAVMALGPRNAPYRLASSEEQFSKQICKTFHTSSLKYRKPLKTKEKNYGISKIP